MTASGHKRPCSSSASVMTTLHGRTLSSKAKFNLYQNAGPKLFERGKPFGTMRPHGMRRQ